MLGPVLFGDYKFLIFTFTNVTNLFGAGNVFLYVGLAKDNNNKNLISFYWIFVFCLSIVGSIFLIPILNSTLYIILFPGQQILHVWIAYVLVFLLFIAQILESATDSCSLTKKASIINIFARVISIAFLLYFSFAIYTKNILYVFSFNYISALLLILGYVYVLHVNNVPILNFRISLKELKQQFQVFYKYSNPLFFLAFTGIPIAFINRWLLQFFGGSLEQGYFSLSDSLSAFVITFSISFAPLLMRDFSISIRDGDIERISSLFTKSISFVFAITSFFSIFILLNSVKATLLLGGKAFEAAALSVSVMILYPIPYTINNILYSYIYSANKTILLRNVALICSIISIIVTFFLVAPKKYFGLDLGAVGFALSMVFGTSLTYLILLKYSVKALNLSWNKIIINHVIVIILFLTIGITSNYISEFFISDSIISFILSGFLYSVGVLLLAIKFDKLFGVSIQQIYSIFLSRLKKSD